MTLEPHPLTPDDKLTVGQIVFTCWKGNENTRRYDIRNYWLVVVVTEDMIPDKMKQSRPVAPMGDTMVPCWLVGKGQL